VTSPDPDLLRAKLASMGRCLQRIVDRCPPDVATLARDLDAQDIVSLNLERLVQLAIDAGLHILASRGASIPGTMRAVFPAMATGGILATDLADRLQRAVGFRNISVHQYDDLDWAIVHAIATDHLGDFRQFIGAITCLIDSSET
jgi:uncharacterized protein YutE (UPF0331/DUF86 family)